MPEKEKKNVYTIRNISNTDHKKDIPNFTVEATPEDVINFIHQSNGYAQKNGVTYLNFFCATDDGIVIESYTIEGIDFPIPDIMRHLQSLPPDNSRRAYTYCTDPGYLHLRG
jgi:hypothetical protein